MFTLLGYNPTFDWLEIEIQSAVEAEGISMWRKGSMMSIPRRKGSTMLDSRLDTDGWGTSNYVRHDSSGGTDPMTRYVCGSRDVPFAVDHRCYTRVHLVGYVASLRTRNKTPT